MLLRNKKSINNLGQIIILYIFSLLIFILKAKTSFRESIFYFIILSLMSGAFIVGHGVYLLTWESTYFNSLITKTVSLKQFFRSKFWLFSFSALFFTIFNILLLIVSDNSSFIFLYLSFLFFNVGIISPVVILVSLFNNERAALDKGIFFNYEGYGAWQYLMLFLELSIPGILYFIFSYLVSTMGAIIIIGLLGIIGIILTNFLNSLIIKLFNKRKYLIIDGFNKK